MLDTSYGNKITVNAHGRTIEMERINFDDINRGDVIAHVWVTNAVGNESYWVGRADMQSYETWYGIEQSRHTAMTNEEWDDRVSASGVSVAHKWHGEVENSGLFRVLSDWDYWTK